VQLAVPFAPLHTVPQAPQSLVLVFRSVSQPLPLFLSQLPKPVSHDAIWQLPVEQVAVAFVRLQLVPHAPQLVSVSSGDSQPSLCGSLLQSPHPAEHAIEQLPPLQLAVPFAPLHTVPQAPQSLVLFWVLVSQPLLDWPSQSAVPALHFEHPQLPLTQFGVPFGQEHTFPQALQLLVLWSRFVSQPFARLLSQSPKPALQVGAHLPAVQLAPPFALVQAFLHTPQLVVVSRLVSQPFVTTPSQSPKPWLQVMPQVPLEQDAVPPLLLQVFLQLPQFAGSVPMLTSQPLPALPSQSA
jgi:hypothetical protein